MKKLHNTEIIYTENTTHIKYILQHIKIKKAITIAFGGDIFSVVLRRCRPIFELILPVDREPFLVCGVVVISRSHVTAIGSSAGWSGRRLLLS